MNIGLNIYTLRKEKKITQAQFAEKIGVSVQAVSKWENNQCAPDVSLFPVIAEYFGVSIDRLFGYSVNSYTSEVEAIMKAADDSMNTYKEIEIISEGLKKYPNSPDLKIYLAFSLSMLYRISVDEEERKESIQKAIRVCEDVVNFCGDIKQVDRALNMLRRIYCEIGEYQKALDAVEKISAMGYRQKIIGKAQILQYRGDEKEYANFTENHLFESYLIMHRLFELKRKSLTEQKKYQEILVWCHAHEKLLSVFDEGCPDFYVSLKIWNCEAQAQAYKNLGDHESCLNQLEILISFTKLLNPHAKGELYQIGVRNPLYFSTIQDPGTQEEFMTGLPLQKIFAKYDKFFGNNEKYLTLKNSIPS